MLDRYKVIDDKRIDASRPNPLMWSTVERQQERYQKHLVANITPLSPQQETELHEGQKEQDRKEALYHALYDHAIQYDTYDGAMDALNDEMREIWNEICADIDDTRAVDESLGK